MLHFHCFLPCSSSGFCGNLRGLSFCIAVLIRRALVVLLFLVPLTLFIIFLHARGYIRFELFPEKLCF